jgi:hypothetical protein
MDGQDTQDGIGSFKPSLFPILCILSIHVIAFPGSLTFSQ